MQICNIAACSRSGRFQKALAHQLQRCRRCCYFPAVVLFLCKRRSEGGNDVEAPCMFFLQQLSAPSHHGTVQAEEGPSSLLQLDNARRKSRGSRLNIRPPPDLKPVLPKQLQASEKVAAHVAICRCCLRNQYPLWESLAGCLMIIAHSEEGGASE